MEKEKQCQHDITGHMWEEYCSKCGMKYGHSPTAEEDAFMLQNYKTSALHQSIRALNHKE